MSNTEELRAFVWKVWTEEERSFVLANAYRKNYISSKDVAPFLNSVRVSNITTWTAPIAFYFLMDKVVMKGLSRGLGFRSTITGFNSIKFLATGAFAVFWVNYNPFYLKSLQDKISLLKLAYKHVGEDYLLGCNDQLPRWTTEQEANRLLRKLYNERNSVWTDILYNRETLGGLKVDKDSYVFLPTDLKVYK